MRLDPDGERKGNFEFAANSLTRCLYQAAEIEESRRMSAVVVERGRVSMGTRAPLLPQVSVVVHGVRGLVGVRCGTLSALLRRRRPHGFDQVRLVAEMHKPPEVTRQSKFSFRRKIKKGIHLMQKRSIFLFLFLVMSSESKASSSWP